MESLPTECLSPDEAALMTESGKVSRRKVPLTLMNWPTKQSATGQHGDEEPYVCADGYLHEFEDGRVECPLCGRGAYSRNEIAIVQWENAHALCCKRRVAVVSA
jgi:hypothetical protein